jgi:hypothetical protein
MLAAFLHIQVHVIWYSITLVSLPLYRGRKRAPSQVHPGGGGKSGVWSDDDFVSLYRKL